MVKQTNLRSRLLRITSGRTPGHYEIHSEMFRSPPLLQPAKKKHATGRRKRATGVCSIADALRSQTFFRSQEVVPLTRSDSWEFLGDTKDLMGMVYTPTSWIGLRCLLLTTMVNHHKTHHLEEYVFRFTSTEEANQARRLIFMGFFSGYPLEN